MRGKVGLKETQSSASRITPAYAGKSAAPHGFRRQVKDHPRICGEKFNCGVFRKCASGSPPHMRGKGSHGPVLFSPIKDHPRICGEKFPRPGIVFAHKGSPPHMRGKGCTAARLSKPLGITPAYAGKSQGRRAGEWTAQDHPRICGEKLSCSTFFCLMAGSPPHMRGKD